MINRHKARILVFGLGLFALSLSLIGWIIPVQAAMPALQTTPMAIGTPAIPNTGANPPSTSLGLGWIVWVILGIAIIALIVALATRSSSTTEL